MTKHDEQFKLKVVQEYLSSSAGQKRITDLHWGPRTRVATWIKLYEAHGIDGLRKKFSHYSAQFRLEVVRRMRADELSYGQTAALFNIRSAASIGRWERCYDESSLEALVPRKRGRPKKMPVPPRQRAKSASSH